mmetsp:Transcript_22537/g.28779  ORF Transcript_22537/g.28779 Transcript_22537/m.28779 type:complete len:394 (-) Transcript_22537:16-1197(-)
MAVARSDVINFGAGPANLPEEVVEQVRDELLNWHGCGMSVMELSHRSAYFNEIQNETLQLARELLHIPDNYDTLLCQGGASTQFAAVPMNLFSSADATADYLITGGWSSRARTEASVFGNVNVVAEGKHSSGIYTNIPAPDTWKLSEHAEYFYYCDNETVFGVEAPKDYIPQTLKEQQQKRNFSRSVPIVVDVSSNFYSRTMDVSEYAVVYGGAQKNLGTAGVTFCIVDKSISQAEPKYPRVPTMLKWKTAACNDSRYNTPPTFSIYVMGRCLHWLQQIGGVEAVEQRNEQKSKLVYDLIDESSLYVNLVEKSNRSRMNIPFRITKPDCDPSDANWDSALEAKFLQEAEKEGLLMLKGHRSAGGMRASLYNSISLTETETLVNFLERFADANK